MNSTVKNLHPVARIESQQVPVSDQTTLRLSKSLHEKLKIIASLERRTLMDVSEAALHEFVRRYESLSGITIEPQQHRKGSALERMLK